MKIREDAARIIDASIRAVLPDEAVARALKGLRPRPAGWSWSRWARQPGRWRRPLPTVWAARCRTVS